MLNIIEHQELKSQIGFVKVTLNLGLIFLCDSSLNDQFQRFYSSIFTLFTTLKAI